MRKNPNKTRMHLSALAGVFFMLSFKVASADFQWKCQYGRSGDDGDIGEVGGEGESVFCTEIENRGKYCCGEKDTAAAPFGGDTVKKGCCPGTAGEPCVP